MIAWEFIRNDNQGLTLNLLLRNTNYLTKHIGHINQ